MNTEELWPGQMLRGCESVWTEVGSTIQLQLHDTKNMSQKSCLSEAQTMALGIVNAVGYRMKLLVSFVCTLCNVGGQHLQKKFRHEFQWEAVG